MPEVGKLLLDPRRCYKIPVLDNTGGCLIVLIMADKKLLTYRPKKLIPGSDIEAGLIGFYAAVPNRGYKGHPFKVVYTYPRTDEDGELVYVDIESEIKDWNRAEKFRKFMDKWGRGAYTLGYFKICETL